MSSGAVSDDDLARFAHAVEQRLGLRVGDDRAAVLARRAAAHHASVSGYVDLLARDGEVAADELGALARELTIGETYFYRHAEQLDAFAAVALPARAEARGPGASIAVLSAGCSSGEEPYTLAMIARERTAALAPRVAITAFDANPAAIARARAARYTRWSLRATPPASERAWFLRDGREYVVAPVIREAVTLGEGNFATPDPRLAVARWDVIFCRNALMYLTEAAAHAAVDRLIAALAPGGYLFLGYAETIRDRAELAVCSTHGAFYYQRDPASRARPREAWYAEIAAATQRVHAIVDGAQSVPGQADAPRAPSPAADAGVPAALVEVRELLSAERYADARARLATLPAETTHARDVALLRAVVLTHAGDGAAAEAACDELLVRDPDNAAGAHYLLALCRDGAGDPREASEHARQAIALDPAFAMAHVELGLLARRAGERDLAARELAAAIELLEHEDEARLALFGGGFGRRALIGLCRAELAA